MIFHWRLSDSKSRLVSKTLLSILENVNSGVVLMVSILILTGFVCFCFCFVFCLIYFFPEYNFYSESPTALHPWQTLLSTQSSMETIYVRAFLYIVWTELTIPAYRFIVKGLLTIPLSKISMIITMFCFI